MGRTLSLLLLVVIVVVLVILGQTAGFYDVPALRGVLRLVPTSQVAQKPASPTPQAAQATLVASPPAVRSPVAARAEECSAGAPRFVHGAAALKAALGAPMGEPVDCERVVDAAGNTEQKTTTGLAYYRARNNVAAFTNGFDHWALTADGLVHWTSDEIEPPPNAQRVG